MALSDLLVATLVIPSIINNIWTYAYHSEQSIMVVNEVQKIKFLFLLDTNSSVYAKTFAILIYSTGFITVYTLVFAAIDRLLVIAYPLFYRSHNMIKVSKYVCVIIWMSSFSVTVYYLLKCKHNCYYYVAILTQTTQKDVHLFSFLTIIFGILLVFILNLLTFFMLRSNNLKAKRISFNKKQKIVYKNEIILGKNLMIVVFAFFMMIVPMFICFIAVSLQKKIFVFSESYQKFNLFTLVLNTSYILFLCETIWNFLVFLWRNKQFKKGFFKLFNTKHQSKNKV